MNKVKIKTAVALCFLLLYFLPSEAQVSYYAASFHGGVTGGGYSPDYFAGGTDSFYVYVEPGSTIHQAYLLAGRHGVAPSLTVTLNGMFFTFDNSNQASPTFQSPFYGGNSAVHAIDVTANINPTVTSYT